MAKMAKEKTEMTLGSVGQRSASFFCKGPDSYYLRLCGPYSRPQLLNPAVALWKQPQRKCQQMSIAVFQQLYS